MAGDLHLVPPLPPPRIYKASQKCNSVRSHRTRVASNTSPLAATLLTWTAKLIFVTSRGTPRRNNMHTSLTPWPAIDPGRAVSPQTRRYIGKLRSPISSYLVDSNYLNATTASPAFGIYVRGSRVSP